MRTTLNKTQNVLFGGRNLWILITLALSLSPGLSFTARAANALFVYAGATMNANDQAVSNRLVTLGYRVQAVLATASATAQAATNDLIVVSSTVSSGDTLTSGRHKFLDSPVPIINWENANYDDLRMTSTAGGQFGSQGSQTSVNIVRANHPLAGGRPLGTNVIFNSAQTVAYGIPLPNAIVIARQVGNDRRAVLFAYERGDELFGGVIAAERRIGVPLDNNFGAANTNGIALFDAAVRWANPTNPAPVLVSEPADATAIEGGTVTFTCEINGARPFSFQWLKNNTAIAGATNRSYSAALALSDNGALYSVRVSNASGSVTSRGAKATVTEDKTPLTIVSAFGSASMTDVTVNFSRPVLPATATHLSNYSFSPPVLVVTAARLSADGKSVVLTTTPQAPGASYTLRVTGVRDTTPALNPITPGTEVNFSAWVLSRGALVFEVFNDVGAASALTAVSNLTSTAKFINNTPDFKGYLTAFDTRTIFPTDINELYGARISGYLTPPSNGLYRFFIRSDDGSQLFLNTNSVNSADAAGKTLICKEDDCCDAFGDASGGPTVSPDIQLVAGQRYYIEALFKEGTGGDYIQVAMREKAVPGNPPSSPPESIPGVLLSAFANPDGAAITIAEQPKSLTVPEGGGARATFSVTATATTLTSTNHSIAYQWQRNGVDIPGANGRSYTAPAVPSNNGAKYRALLLIPGKETVSQEATLNVTPDTAAPTLVSAKTYSRQDKLEVVFSEPVSDATATKIANYTLNNGVNVVSAAKTAPNTAELTIATPPLTVAPSAPAVTLMEFNFDEGSGTTVRSKDGRLTGTFVGTPTFTNDTPSGVKGDFSLRFAAGQRVSVPDPTKVLALDTNNSSFTIQAWVKFATPTARSVFFYNNGPGGAVSASVFTNRTAFVTTLGIVDQRSNASIPNDDAWHHMAVVHDFGQKQIRFYVDGVLGDTVANYTRGVIFTRTNQVFYIGSEPTGGLQYVGLLDRLTYKKGVVPPTELDNRSVPRDSGALLAYEGFDYSAGPIPGQQGGKGWAAAWQTNNPAGSAVVQEGSLNYIDARGNALVTSGGKGYITGQAGTSQPFRQLPSVRTADGTTSWFSFIGARVGPTTNNTAQPANPFPRAANVSLFNSTLASSAEQLAVGSGTGATNNTWALLPDGSVNNRQGSTAPYDQVSFVAVRIDHKAGNDDAYLWVNPALDAEPTLTSASARSVGAFDYSFNRIRPFAGNPQPNDRRPHAELIFDELRVGLTFAAVAPFTKAAETVLVPLNATQMWRYENTGKDLGTAWKDKGFNDSAWPQGPALLAFETGATAEPIRTQLKRTNSVGGTIITDYFRTRFTFAGDPAKAKLSLRHVVDDGVVIYLNGTEIHRFFMAAGPVTATTQAAPSDHENRYEGPYDIPATALVEGENVLAAEVHQRGLTSSDVVFGLELKSFAPPAAAPPAPTTYGIGLNFGANEANASLAPTNVAGVASVAQANWNNLRGASGSTNKMVANVAGAAEPTVVGVTWGSNNTWASTGPRGEENNRFPTNSADRVLMTGYLDTGSATTTSITVSNIPPQLSFNGYDVYVYILGGVPNKGGGYRILDASSKAVLKDYVLAQCSANPTNYVQVPPNTPALQYGVGNYLVFSGLSSSSIIIEATTTVPFAFGSTPRAPINAVQLVSPSSGPPPSGPIPTAGLRLTVNGVQDLAEKPNSIAANAQLLVNSDPALPLDFAQMVNAYQDDFVGATLNPNWKPRGPTLNLYTLTNGVLRVVGGAGDPNHLLYEAPGYNPTNQEVLARIRILAFGTGDGPRLGVSVGVATNSQGINWHFRDANHGDAGVTINGRQMRLLDDLRAWGPGYDFRPVGANRWRTNEWYWMRVKQEPNTATGQADIFGKVWSADGMTPEPANWQISWDRYPTATVRSGFAGIAAGVVGGLATFEVDYILIKAAGLKTIKAGGGGLSPKQALLVTAATPSAGDRVVENRLVTLGYRVTIVSDTGSRTSDAAGKDVIVISSTVGSGNMLSGGVHKFRDVAVPLVNYESASYDDLNMTGTASTQFGTTATQTSINIINASHPLAAGLPLGTNVIFTSAQTITWGIPLPNAIVIARPVTTNTQAVIFGYEQGDELFGGLRAAERRLGFVLNDASPTAANAATAALFDAAILWLDPIDRTPVFVSEPADVTVVENLTASFASEVNGGRPFSYQWLKNGTAIQGATDRRYSAQPAFSDNGALFSVRVSNTSGTITSRGAKVTVTRDTNAPVLVSAVTGGNPTIVTVTFSEPLSDVTGLNEANYSISGGVAVSGAFFGADARTVLLVTSGFADNGIYTLTVKEVTDQAATPNKINPNPSSIVINTGHGVLAVETFTGIGGTAVANLTSAAKYLNNTPDLVTYISSFNYSPNLDNYGARISGYFIAPSNGVYRFFIRSDDASQLFMNTNGIERAGAVLIAKEDDCCDAFGDASGGPSVSPNIRMVAGQKYFMEALLKEGGGGDYLQVAFREQAVTGNPPNTESISAQFLSSLTPSAPVDILVQPASQTVLEQEVVTFTVKPIGTPSYGYQWYRNGVAIAGATAQSYTIPSVTLALNGAAISVVVNNSFSTAASADAILKVVPDVTRPAIVSAVGRPFLTEALVTFSETLDRASAETVRNYSVSGGLTVTRATLGADRKSVVLATSPQKEATIYTVTVNGVKDTSGAGNTIAANSSVNFTAWVLSRGFVLFEAYDTSSTGGTAVSVLTAHPNYPNNPRERLYMSEFNTRTVYPNDSHEQYGARMSGFFIAPSNGFYRFFVRSDDASQLFMSTNNATSADPARKVLIAREDACCNNYGATAAGGPRVSPEIQMIRGQSYYIEALLKEGGGGDFFQAAFRERAVTGNPPNAESIPGISLSTYANPEGATITIVQQPESVNVPAGTPVTFKVAAVASTAGATSQAIFYQWQKNAIDIPGANGSSYSTPPNPIGETGSRYRVVLSIPGRSLASQDAVITVGRDTTLPALVSANTYTRTNKVTVVFSEAVSDATATRAANYTINNNVTVQSVAKLAPTTVELTTSAITPGPFYVLTVSGVQDLSGNTIRPRSRILIDTEPALPTDFGVLVNGFQDDFGGTALASAWRARGPATNVYRVANGLLSVTNATGDPNHLLYEVAGYNSTNQEVLARIRVNRFGTGDQPRAGIGVCVATNSQGINYHFRNEGTLGVHTEFLDDLRSWGPELNFKWETNKWYWMRLKQQPNTASGQPDAFAKIWLADGTAPEPADWQSTWDRYPAASVRSGFAGVTAGSANGVGVFDVDYILIKADGLSPILAGGSEINVLGRSGRANTVQLQNTLRNADSRTVVLADETLGQRILSINRIDPDGVVIEMEAVPGRAYKLQASSDLNTWTEIGSATGSAQGRVLFLDSEGSALEQRFYRTLSP